MDDPRTRDVGWLAEAVSHLSESERETLVGLVRSWSGEGGPGSGARTTLTGAGLSAETEDEPGAVIGRYKILECIGEGGFGSVFVAEQSEPVRRRVALKILKRGMDTQKVVARFEAERQALAMMDHPNIAKVLDAGQTPSGRPFFAMELVRGEPITRFCDSARLGIDQRIGLVREVCAAVQHAHQKGIIHRDLKPSNVLVTVQDGQPVPKVIDFGIAKAVHSRLAEETVYTQVHQMIGTPIYMSPEQTGASAMDVDTRTDVYSLGVLLYELLVGTTPFEPERFRGMSLAEMQRVILEEQPPRPSARLAGLGPDREPIAQRRGLDPRRLQRRLQGDLDWIVMRCLEKDRARRYEGANALEEDLARHLATEPVRAGPPSAIYLARKFVRRNRAQVVAASLIVVLLLGGLGGTVFAWDRARQQSERLRFTLDFFSRALAGAADESSTIAVWTDRPDLTLGDALRSAEANIEETFSQEPALEAMIRELIGLAQLRAGEFDAAAMELARTVAIRSEAYGPSSPETARLLLPLADAQSKTGDFEGSMRTAQRAHELGTQLRGPDHPETRAAALWLARWYASGYHFDDAERYFGLASREIEGVADARDPITVAATIDGCAVLLGKGRLDRAEQILTTAAPRIAELPASLDTVKAKLQRRLGMVLTLRGDYAGAIRTLSEVHPGGTGDAGDRVRQRLLAWAIGRAGRIEESAEMFESLVAREQQAPAPRIGEIFARIYFADVLLDHARPADALAQIGPAVRQYDALGLPNDPDRLWALSLLGRAMLETGDTEGAGAVLAEAAQSDALFPEHRLYLPEIRFARARWLLTTGDTDAGAKLMASAVAEARSIFGPDHPVVRAMVERSGP
jgi:tetratricopeptide (TPR) repeat protein